MNELEQSYLEHHGILGQRWHHRNGPPYPLDAGDHSKSEINAGYKKSLGGGRNENLYDRKSVSSGKRATKTLNYQDMARTEDQYKANTYRENAKRYDEKYGKEISKYSSKAQKLYDKADRSKNAERAEKLRNKADKVIDKGSSKANKFAEKFNEYDTKSKEFQEYANEHKAATEAIINEMLDKGYHVNSTEIHRLANRGEACMASMLGTVIAGPVIGVAAGAGIAKYDKGKQYKVWKDKTKPAEHWKEEKKKESAVDKFERENMETAKRVLKDQPASTKEEIRFSTNNVIKANKDTLSKSIAKDMVADMRRWNKEDSSRDHFGGKSESEIQKSIESKLQKQLSNIASENKYFDPWFSKDGTIEFGINGVSEYSDSAPMTIKYDPEKKKVIDFWYT